LTLATLNLGNVLETARASIDLRVFLQDDLDPSQQAALQPRLLEIPGVERVSYISADMALQEFRAVLGEDAEILDLLDSNPLPASFHLALEDGARNLDSVRAIRTEVGVWPEVAEIIFNQGWVDALERWTVRFQVASLVVGLIVFFAAVFVISNTVKLTIAASARVIQVQKLVGATNSFIRIPFLCEGMIQGFLAGVLAMGLVAAAGKILGPRMTGVVFFSPLQIGGFVLFCVVLGMTGSWTAMRKYLTLRSEM